MEPVEDRLSLDRLYRTAMILAAAVVASMPVYVLAVEFLKRKGVRFVPGLRPGSAALLRYALYGAAVLTVILIRVLRGLILRKRPGDDAALLGRKLFQASVLTSALSEVPALLGLALFLTAGLYRDFFILALVSLFLMFMFFPRFNNWSDWAGGSSGS